MFTPSNAQLEAVTHLKNGSILCGDVGSGKSWVGLSYYYNQNQQNQSNLTNPSNLQTSTNSTQTSTNSTQTSKPLYIITTARKRDTLEWENELTPFQTDPTLIQPPQITIDSWNNLHKYTDVTNSFFLFDEQRVSGSGAWVKAFLKITKTNNNAWILLSATPGDKWLDYIPVFVANGFYRNRSDFLSQHVVYNTYTRYPKVERYTNTHKLISLRDKILVNMVDMRKTTMDTIDIQTSYDQTKYFSLLKTRWNPYTDQPFKDSGELCYALRRVTNESPDRLNATLHLTQQIPKLIIFYNFDYELSLLREALTSHQITFSEWNGHKHEPLPQTDSWVYLVQYTSGAEGWNCIQTDSVLFYSLNYSYRLNVQAAGRINRLNTPYTSLHCYRLISKSSIDRAILASLRAKKDFNELRFIRK